MYIYIYIYVYRISGTAACNGDSGGGFVVFVPDARIPSYSYPLKSRSGAWYVKGIVSVTLVKEDLTLCDPKAYTVFTDVAKYRNWILKYLWIKKKESLI